MTHQLVLRASVSDSFDGFFFYLLALDRNIVSSDTYSVCLLQIAPEVF